MRYHVLLSLLWLTLLFTGAPSVRAQQADGQDYSNEKIGIKLTLPSDKWKKTDFSQGKAFLLVFSPRDDLLVRCSVIHMPKALMPEGLLTREEQLKAVSKGAYTRVAYNEISFLDRPAMRLEYTSHLTRTIEWCLEDGDAYFVFQLSAPQKKWDTPDDKALLTSIRDSLQFTGAKMASDAATSEIPTQEQIRKQRRARIQLEDSDFELAHHTLQIKVVPEAKTLHVHDELLIRSETDRLSELSLYFSVVKVDSVTAPVEVTWKTQPLPTGPAQDPSVQELLITFAEPLSRGDEVTLTVRASCEDFIHELDQQLITEVAVMGQVRERSSYSSHVVYYPIDHRNDASMDVTLTVPAGYTGVTGGNLVEASTENGQSRFRYVTRDRRPRILPFGFAVGKYIHQSGTSAGGLTLTVYGYEGEESLVSQRIAAGIEAIEAFEKLMGPLPWNDVRFVHVTPQRKETGVSLPGMILVSKKFFTDISDVDMSGGNLQDADVLSLLILADELSHQWNAYAVPWPNELAEGISTFTNALFAERRHDKEAFVNTIRFCRDGYFQASVIGRDVAIANPDIYLTPAYRGIAFCKTAVALAMLRDYLGDEKFFAGWRAAFGQFDRKQDGFEVIESVFSKSTGEDLAWFFEQWFYRPGWPKLMIDLAQTGKDLTLDIQQVQSGKPYRLHATLVIHGKANEELKHEVTLTTASTKIELECPFQATKVQLDPSKCLLAEVLEQD